MAIIIHQDATEYSSFKSVSCSTCFGWYFTHHQQLITLYLQYLALMRPVLLPVVNVAGCRATFTIGHDVNLRNPLLQLQATLCYCMLLFKCLVSSATPIHCCQHNFYLPPPLTSYNMDGNQVI